MDNELKGAIEVLIARVEKKTSEITALKTMINALCVEAGADPVYSDTAVPGNSASTIIQPDKFYGKSPTVAAREYLDMRGRAITLDEILDALIKGGFDFESVAWNDPSARLRNLGISLGKNSGVFHRLPNDTWGLVKFYPEVERRAKQRKAKPTNGQGSESTATEDEQPEAVSN